MPVYRIALEFHALAYDLAAALPRGKTNLEQLESAAASIVLSLTEGAGEFSRREKVRFYRMSLRSAAECAAIVDLAATLRAVRAERVHSAKLLFHHISISLIALIRHLERGPAAKGGENAADLQEAEASPSSSSSRPPPTAFDSSPSGPWEPPASSPPALEASDLK